MTQSGWGEGGLLNTFFSGGLVIDSIGAEELICQLQIIVLNICASENILR